MNRKILLLALSAALLPGLAGADDKTTVYRTVNADGTVTYSQIESNGAESQLVDGRDPRTGELAEAPAEATPAAAAGKTAEEQGCDNAKSNLAVLNSGQALMRTDAEGKSTKMTDEEIASARATAERMITAFCPQS